MTCDHGESLLTHFAAGELESTFLESVCRGANLKALLQGEKAMTDIPEFISAIAELDAEEIRGTRVSDFRNSSGSVKLLDSRPKESKLDGPSYLALQAFMNNLSSEQQYVVRIGQQCYGKTFLEHQVKTFRRLVISGVRYGTVETSERDSNIAFRIDDRVEVGQIQRIFVHPQAAKHDLPDNGVLIEVRYFKALRESDAKNDEYRKFGFGGGYLCYNQLAPSPVIIEASRVVCHIAKTNLSRPFGLTMECIHVLLLDQVGSG
jgi:hypothetical protein